MPMQACETIDLLRVMTGMTNYGKLGEAAVSIALCSIQISTRKIAPISTS